MLVLAVTVWLLQKLHARKLTYLRKKMLLENLVENINHVTFWRLPFSLVDRVNDNLISIWMTEKFYHRQRRSFRVQVLICIWLCACVKNRAIGAKWPTNPRGNAIQRIRLWGFWFITDLSTNDFVSKFNSIKYGIHLFNILNWLRFSVPLA